MKVALTIWEGRISPVFDSARMLLIVDIENRTVTGKHYEPFHSVWPSYRGARLFDLGINVLICGAVSHFFATMVEVYDIRIISFVRGDANDVLSAYLTGTLSTPQFRMPGYEAGYYRRAGHGRARKKTRVKRE